MREISLETETVTYLEVSISSTGLEIWSVSNRDGIRIPFDKLAIDLDLDENDDPEADRAAIISGLKVLIDRVKKEKR